MPKPPCLRSPLPSVYTTARAYVAAGLSIIPIRVDGSKAPDIPSWERFKYHLPRATEIRDWFHRSDPAGIGIVAGPVSGNLVVLDFDDRGCYDAWKAIVKQKRPRLWAKLVRIATPSGGRHIYFRTTDAGVYNRFPHKLAARLPDQKLSRDDQPRLTKCEWQFKGRYVVAPGSPAACHPTNGVYRELSDTKIMHVKCLLTTSVDFLIKTVQQFDERPQRRLPQHPSMSQFIKLSSAARGGSRPGDEFEVIMNWDEILEPHGWHFQEQRGDVEYWCRPGKDEGISASINYADCGLLYVFSSNAAPLEDGQAYSKFSAYTFLNHDGDFGAAASALLRQGFGGDAMAESQSTGRWDHIQDQLFKLYPPCGR